MMLFVAAMFLGLVACAPKDDSDKGDANDNVIHVYTRDSSSDTREALVKTSSESFIVSYVHVKPNL